MSAIPTNSTALPTYLDVLALELPSTETIDARQNTALQSWLAKFQKNRKSIVQEVATEVASDALLYYKKTLEEASPYAQKISQAYPLTIHISYGPLVPSASELPTNILYHLDFKTFEPFNEIPANISNIDQQIKNAYRTIANDVAIAVRKIFKTLQKEKEARFHHYIGSRPFIIPPKEDRFNHGNRVISDRDPYKSDLIVIDLSPKSDAAIEAEKTKKAAQLQEKKEEDAAAEEAMARFQSLRDVRPPATVRRGFLAMFTGR